MCLSTSSHPKELSGCSVHPLLSASDAAAAAVAAAATSVTTTLFLETQLAKILLGHEIPAGRTM